MPSTAPRLDGRDLAAILRQAKALQPFYTPEWRPREGEAGTALLEIAARLLEGTIQRLDQAPGKHLLAFLDMIGVKLVPAQPARVPLSFLLSEGAREPVVIPARTRAAAKPAEGGDPVLFETETAIVAAPVAISAVLSAVPAQDLIFDHTAGLSSDAAGGATLFSGEDRQEHALYLGHATLFKVEGPVRIELAISPFDSRLIPVAPRPFMRVAPGVQWEYLAGEKEETRGGETVKVPDWRRFDAVRAVDGRLVLARQDAGPIAKRKIAGVESRWIRCRVETGASARMSGVRIETIRATVAPLAPLAVQELGSAGIAPDLAFANDVEVAPAAPGAGVHPFGPRPRVGDTFYLASGEGFSKQGARITLRLTLQAEPPPKASPDLALAWEHWDGRGWRMLPNLEDSTDHLSKPGAATISFDVPAGLQPVTVFGQESLWIRARITSGDYGREIFKVDKGGEVTQTPDFHPPVIDGLRIDYVLPPAPLEAVLSGNNLDLEAWLGTAALRPFSPLPAGHPAVYVGFDRPVEKGPFSLFFSLREQEVTEEDRPRIEWEMRVESPGEPAGRWVRLAVLDGTRGLTESGTLQLFPPPGLAAGRLFGREAWWLRAVDALDRFQESPPPAVSGPAVPPVAPALVEPGLKPCSQRDPQAEALRNLPHPSLSGGAQGGGPPWPRLHGVYPNTAWAVQGETFEGEILGSATGLAGQRFATGKAPVFDEEIWIDELDTLSAGERAALAARPDVEHRQTADETGTALSFQIRWRPVEDLATAGPDDRVYAIDRATGQIELGDGSHGRAAPPGRDNVRATYRAGGGARGNVAAGTITSLRTTIPLVDSTFNPEPASGGADTEPLTRAIERGPQRIHHRGRAVTRADYEALAREASPAVARARCLPCFDDGGRERSGWVTVVIVPESRAARPVPSPGLRRRVAEALRARAANVAAFPGRVRVVGPAWVEVRVAAELFASAPDLAPAVEAAAFRRLGEILHPLTGGYEGRGWEFGRLPCRSDFFAMLEAIPGLDHVESLAVTLVPVDQDGSPAGPATEITADRPVEATLPEYALIYSGEHRLRSGLLPR